MWSLEKDRERAKKKILTIEDAGEENNVFI
jgi:hypothetical protein